MTAQLHSDRDHATWSASASSRNFSCAGALALTMNLPETTSEAADWGTCCHQISERCLRDGGDADRFIGTTEKGKKHSFEVDEEMAETAQRYIDYCRGRIADYKAATGDDAIWWIEERFSLSKLNPPFDAGGTGDFVIYFPKWQLLEVVDLKGGRGVVVAAKKNPQGRTYCLGAILAHPELDVYEVMVTIVQPRAGHPDGRIRSETFHVIDLMEWAADMMEAMQRSAQALADRAKITGPLTEQQWADLHLSPGPHCADTFCKAQGICPALRKKAEDAIGLHFTPIGEPVLANQPDSGSPEERAARLDMLDMIEGWVKAVRAHEHSMAEMGQPAPGYGLVEAQKREKWKDGAEDVVRAVAVKAEVPTAAFLNPAKLRTPKQVREAFKKAKADASALAGLSETPAGGTNLVRIDQTTRTVKSSVETHFEAIKE